MPTNPRGDQRKAAGNSRPVAAPSASRSAQVNVAVASQQELLECCAYLRHAVDEVQTVRLQCHKPPAAPTGSNTRGRRTSQHVGALAQPAAAFQTEQHRAAVCQAAATLSTEKLRHTLPDALCRVLGGGSLLTFQLSVKLPLKLYEQLAAALQANSSLEVLSLAGSCCGDAALSVLAAALTAHPKLQVLELPGCSLSDAAAGRLATLVKAQAAAAAQQGWVSSLRGSAGAGARERQQAAAQAGSGAPAGVGLRLLDLSFNEVTAAALPGLAAALCEEHSSLLHLNLASNDLMPAPREAAAVLLTVLRQDPPSRQFTANLASSSSSSGSSDAATDPTACLWAGTFVWSGAGQNNNSSSGSSGQASLPRRGRRVAGAGATRLPPPPAAACPPAAPAGDALAPPARPLAPVAQDVPPPLAYGQQAARPLHSSPGAGAAGADGAWAQQGCAQDNSKARPTAHGLPPEQEQCFCSGRDCLASHQHHQQHQHQQQQAPHASQGQHRHGGCSGGESPLVPNGSPDASSGILPVQAQRQPQHRQSLQQQQQPEQSQVEQQQHMVWATSPEAAAAASPTTPDSQLLELAEVMRDLAEQVEVLQQLYCITPPVIEQPLLPSLQAPPQQGQQEQQQQHFNPVAAGWEQQERRPGDQLSRSPAGWPVLQQRPDSQAQQRASSATAEQPFDRCAADATAAAAAALLKQLRQEAAGSGVSSLSGATIDAAGGFDDDADDEGSLQFVAGADWLAVDDISRRLFQLHGLG